MTTEYLEEFEMLASILNYSKASEKLSISQSVLSRHIQDLERELRVSLFVRDKHSVRLTDEGRYLLKWVRIFLRKTQETISELTALHHSFESTLRVICAEQTLNTHVLNAVRGFKRTHSRINLDISSLSGSVSRKMIFDTDILIAPCDFVIMPESKADGVLLTTQEALVAIPPSHHYGDMQELKLEDLSGETLIVPFADEAFGPYAKNAMLAHRKCHGDLYRIGVKSEKAALLMVELGDGISIIPHHLKHSVYPHTRTIPIVDQECAFPIYMYRNLSYENPAGAVFWNEMLEVCREKAFK